MFYAFMQIKPHWCSKAICLGSLPNLKKIHPCLFYSQDKQYALLKLLQICSWLAMTKVRGIFAPVWRENMHQGFSKYDVLHTLHMRAVLKCPSVTLVKITNSIWYLTVRWQHRRWFQSQLNNKWFFLIVFEHIYCTRRDLHWELMPLWCICNTDKKIHLKLLVSGHWERNKHGRSPNLMFTVWVSSLGASKWLIDYGIQNIL